MKSELTLGSLMSGQPFTIPRDAVARTFACIGIRGAGKTVAATVMAEEMCQAGLLWGALDPVGVWWGLRSTPEGRPGGFPVVVIGGQHGDIPLDPSAGRRIADAVLQDNICFVIDLKLESKNAWRKFVADFCDRLMELNPVLPRHLFIEEAPEFVPQKPMGEQKRSLAAVDRLIRLGRNQGYGATLISQRFATIQKDVLTQCENLLALRNIGKTDRDACADWIAEVVEDTHSLKKAEEFVQSLATLGDGEGWFWSPQWLNRFVRVQVRKRMTYHPGKTRTLGEAPDHVQMADVGEFVERFKAAMKQQTVTMPPASKNAGSPVNLRGAAYQENVVVDTMQQDEILRLRGQVKELADQKRGLEQVIATLRKRLEPEYRDLQLLFGELEKVSSNGTGTVADASIWEPWKSKLGAGPAKVIDILLSRGDCTRIQLKTLSGYSERSMTNYISALNSNQLIEKVEGGRIRLRIP